jgi:hypothetical protein
LFLLGRALRVAGAALRDMVAIGGIACVVNGVRMWNVPAAWIVGGVMILTAATLHARRAG